VKIKKPEDEKYFKDIVLNDILEEISNEGEGTVTHTSHIKKRKTSQKKRSTQTLLFMAIFILLILFIITLFRLLTDAAAEVKPVFQTPKSTILHSDTQEWKMEEDRVGSTKSTAPKVIKTKHISKKEVTPKTIEIKAVKSKPLPKQKTQRELAKEALRQQMLH
jgi:hypothetical protein